jgi:N-acetylglucosamine kinase-like BadF-type ATPase
MGFYCGWDGGGSKTEVLCVDESGKELARGNFGSLNINGAPEERVAQTIADAIALMRSAGGLEECLGLVIGAAGVSNARVSAFIEQKVRETGYAGKLRIVGDHEIALQGAVSGPGAVLIAGTGSICFGADACGRSARAGGFGYIIDDGGSGYAIGRDILAAVVRAQDGRGCETCMTEPVMKQLDVQNIREMTTWLYSAQTGKKEIAALAPLLNRALEKGDEAAQEIAAKAAKELAEMAITVWSQLGLESGELALTGSVLEHYPAIREGVSRLCREFSPAMNVIFPRGSACEGAVKMAMHL